MSRDCVWRDDQQRDPHTEAKSIDYRRYYVIVEPARVVPCHKDSCGLPLRPFHHRIYLLHGPILADARAIWWMLALNACHDPTHSWQISVLCVGHKLVCGDNMLSPQITVTNVIDGIKRGKHVSPLPLR